MDISKLMKDENLIFIKHTVLVKSCLEAFWITGLSNKWDVRQMGWPLKLSSFLSCFFTHFLGFYKISFLFLRMHLHGSVLWIITSSIQLCHWFFPIPVFVLIVNKLYLHSIYCTHYCFPGTFCNVTICDKACGDNSTCRFNKDGIKYCWCTLPGYTGSKCETVGFYNDLYI